MCLLLKVGYTINYKKTIRKSAIFKNDTTITDNENVALVLMLWLSNVFVIVCYWNSFVFILLFCFFDLINARKIDIKLEKKKSKIYLYLSLSLSLRINIEFNYASAVTNTWNIYLFTWVYVLEKIIIPLETWLCLFIIHFWTILILSK